MRLPARLARGARTLLLVGVALSGCGGGGGGSGKAQTRARTSTAARRPPTAVTPTSREVSPGVVRASAAGLSATMRPSGHHPRVNRPWPIGFEVSRAGRPVTAQLRYQYLFAGQVVARRSHYRFTGRFHDTFIWPASALGYPLTFRAVVTAADVTLNLDYPVQVAR